MATTVYNKRLSLSALIGILMIAILMIAIGWHTPTRPDCNASGDQRRLEIHFASGFSGTELWRKRIHGRRTMLRRFAEVIGW
nr:hypothetical protein [Rubripirellula sp.]